MQRYGRAGRLDGFDRRFGCGRGRRGGRRSGWGSGALLLEHRHTVLQLANDLEGLLELHLDLVDRLGSRRIADRERDGEAHKESAHDRRLLL
jgi:hypothetical protein